MVISMIRLQKERINFSTVSYLLLLLRRLVTGIPRITAIHVWILTSRSITIVFITLCIPIVSTTTTIPLVWICLSLIINKQFIQPHFTNYHQLLENKQIHHYIITCLFEGLRPHDRRTFCPPNSVPFSIRSASSAHFLMHQNKTTIKDLPGYKMLQHAELLNSNRIRYVYLSANWTKPHRLPAGIFTWTNSPYWLKTCLKWSSLTLASKLPTKICN